jgi:hypothetical protein
MATVGNREAYDLRKDPFPLGRQESLSVGASRLVSSICFPFGCLQGKVESGFIPSTAVREMGFEDQARSKHIIYLGPKDTSPATSSPE